LKGLLSTEELSQIAACPSCKKPIRLEYLRDAVCSYCNENYSWFAGSWHLIPSTYKSSQKLWDAWENLQHNGLMTYINDPDHNLGVGEREDYLAFGRFCDFSGLVLDVGCGPQPWPTHFKATQKIAHFVGVDPLIETTNTDYTQLRALGEFLPFRNSVFHHVVFATSIDHFIEPNFALKEAFRVCQKGGEIDIWFGEKIPNAPAKQTSPDWFKTLIKPEEAEDCFHFKRLSSKEFEKKLTVLGMNIIEKVVLRVDKYRNNLFYKVKI
jgi:SAM-dependent methyltransferase